MLRTETRIGVAFEPTAATGPPEKDLPPYRVTVATGAFHDDIETRRMPSVVKTCSMASVSEIFLTVQSSLGALLKTIEPLFNTRLRGAVRLSFMAAFRL